MFGGSNDSVVYAASISSAGFPQRQILAGNMDIPGYVDGKTYQTFFNDVNSLVVFRNDQDKILNEKFKEVYVLKEDKVGEYVVCLESIKTGDTLTQESCFVSDESQEVTVDQLLFYYNEEAIAASKQDSFVSHEFIILADTGNHCIRMINMTEMITYTIGGKCTENGFADGPLEYSRFDSPSFVGTDPAGNIYVQDSGNEYLRVIEIDWLNFDFRGIWIHTLLNGACIDDSIEEGTENILCYRLWRKTSGEPSQHIFDADLLETLCSGSDYPFSICETSSSSSEEASSDEDNSEESEE